MGDLAADHLPVTPALEAACRALGTTPKLADAGLLRCVRAGITAERERITNLGSNPLAGRCAYEAFATATRDVLNLPAWDAIPADARVHWQMTADALLMFATLEAGNG